MTIVEFQNDPSRKAADFRASPELVASLLKETFYFPTRLSVTNHVIYVAQKNLFSEWKGIFDCVKSSTN